MPRHRTDHHSSAQVKELVRDLQRLREDFGKMTEQIERVANGAGGDILDDVKGRLNSFAGTVDDFVTSLGDRGNAALGTVEMVRGNLTQNVEGAVREHPLTTVAVAIGVGFMLSSAMRR